MPRAAHGRSVATFNVTSIESSRARIREVNYMRKTLVCDRRSRCCGLRPRRPPMAMPLRAAVSAAPGVTFGRRWAAAPAGRADPTEAAIPCAPMSPRARSIGYSLSSIRPSLCPPLLVARGRAGLQLNHGPDERSRRLARRLRFSGERSGRRARARLQRIPPAIEMDELRPGSRSGRAWRSRARPVR